jgi:hypothetical protein
MITLIARFRFMAMEGKHETKKKEITATTIQFRQRKEQQ